MKIRSKKWYGRIWPPERRKVKMMQAILDYHQPEIEDKFQEAVTRELIYGVPVEETLRQSRASGVDE